MADNPPQNREQRRAARYGRHRTDVRDAHDPWPTSEPNPALGETAAAGSPEQDQASPTATAAADAAQPDAPTADVKDTKPGTKPKG